MQVNDAEIMIIAFNRSHLEIPHSRSFGADFRTCTEAGFTLAVQVHSYREFSPWG